MLMRDEVLRTLPLQSCTVAHSFISSSTTSTCCSWRLWYKLRLWMRPSVSATLLNYWPITLPSLKRESEPYKKGEMLIFLVGSVRSQMVHKGAQDASDISVKGLAAKWQARHGSWREPEASMR